MMSTPAKAVAKEAAAKGGPGIPQPIIRWVKWTHSQQWELVEVAGEEGDPHSYHTLGVEASHSSGEEFRRKAGKVPQIMGPRVERPEEGGGSWGEADSAFSTQYSTRRTPYAAHS